MAIAHVHYDKIQKMLTVELGEEAATASSSEIVRKILNLLVWQIRDEVSRSCRRPDILRVKGTPNVFVHYLICDILGEMVCAIAVFDQTIDKYVVCTSKTMNYRVGDLID